MEVKDEIVENKQNKEMSEEGEDAASRKTRPEEDENEGEDEEDEVDMEEEEEEEEGEREDKEMLFLIEFLVDALCINMKNLNTKNIDPCMLDGQTCVVLTFLNFPPMSLCEKDWGAENDDTTEDMIKFNAGKSLMFALSESQFRNPPPIYLDVSAHRTMPHCTADPKLQIGKTKICLTELFKQVFDRIEEKPNKLPVSKSIKDSYPMVGSNSKKSTGEIVLYIRLSCLGQNVITEFQRGGDECEPFLFKNKESNKVYECKAKEDPLDEDGGDLCPPCPGWGDSGPRAKSRCGAAASGAAYSGGDLDDEEFEEFGTEVHGHALTIKIQKSTKRGAKGGSDPCDCSGPAGNQIAFQLPQNQIYCKGESGGPKIYPMKDCRQGQEPVRITAGGEDDEEKDIFLLRIGKKGEMNGKGKLELELRTPKQKKDRAPKGPKKMDKEVQTDREETAGKKGKKKK